MPSADELSGEGMRVDFNTSHQLGKVSVPGYEGDIHRAGPSRGHRRNRRRVIRAFATIGAFGREKQPALNAGAPLVHQIDGEPRKPTAKSRQKISWKIGQDTRLRRITFHVVRLPEPVDKRIGCLSNERVVRFYENIDVPQLRN
jgi:hypothetical protein